MRYVLRTMLLAHLMLTLLGKMRWGQYRGLPSQPCEAQGVELGLVWL